MTRNSPPLNLDIELIDRSVIANEQAWVNALAVMQWDKADLHCFKIWHAHTTAIKPRLRAALAFFVEQVGWACQRLVLIADAEVAQDFNLRLAFSALPHHAEPLLDLPSRGLGATFSITGYR